MIECRVGAYDNPLCPMPYVEWGYDDNDAYGPLPSRTCDADLHLELATSGPVLTDAPATPMDIAGDAHCSSWRLICENGHILATSTSDEVAEPFDASLILRLVPKS